MIGGHCLRLTLRGRDDLVSITSPASLLSSLPCSPHSFLEHHPLAPLAFLQVDCSLHKASTHSIPTPSLWPVFRTQLKGSSSSQDWVGGLSLGPPASQASCHHGTDHVVLPQYLLMLKPSNPTLHAPQPEQHLIYGKTLFWAFGLAWHTVSIQ